MEKLKFQEHSNFNDYIQNDNTSLKVKMLIDEFWEWGSLAQICKLVGFGGGINPHRGTPAAKEAQIETKYHQEEGNNKRLLKSKVLEEDLNFTETPTLGHPVRHRQGYLQLGLLQFYLQTALGIRLECCSCSTPPP